MPSRYLTSDNYVVDTLTVNGVTVTSGDIAAYDPTTVSGAVASGNAALVDANTAQASGNAALFVTTTALASGNAAIPLSQDALASGNLALSYLVGASGIPGAWAPMIAGVALSSGDAVGLNNQGTIEPTRTIAVSPSATPSLSSATRITTNSISPDSSTAYSKLHDVFLSVYPDGSVYDYGTCTTFRLTSSGTFDKGTPLIFESVPCKAFSCAYSTADDVFGVAYGVNPSGIPKSIAIKASGLYTQAGPSNFIGQGGKDFIALNSNTALAYSEPADCFIFAYPANVNSYYRMDTLTYNKPSSEGIVGSFTQNVSSPLIGFNGSTTFSSGYVSACASPNYPVATVVAGTREALYAYSCKITSRTINNNSIIQRTIIPATATSKNSSIYDPFQDRVIIGYVDLSASSSCKVVAVNFDDGSANTGVGAPVTVNASLTDNVQLVYDYPNSRFHVAYSNAATNTNLNVAVGSVSDLSVTVGTSASLTVNSTSSYSAAYSEVQTKPIFTFADSQQGNALTAFSCSAGSGTQYYPQIQGSPSYIGVAQASVSGGQSVNVALSRSIDKNQSGLSVGKYQYIDYTISGSFTSNAAKPSYWPYGEPWLPVAQSINSSTVVLLRSY